MDLMSALRKFAFKKPRIFFIQASGGTHLRLKTENWLHEQNWRQSNSPASTDILIICGQADKDMVNAIARTQQILPKPAATVLFSAEKDNNNLQADVYVSGDDIKSALNNARLHLWQNRDPSLTPIKEDDKHESNGKHGDHTNGNHDHSHKEENKPESNQGDDIYTHDGQAKEEEHKEQENDHEEHDHKGHNQEGHDHNGHDHEDHEHESHEHEGHDHHEMKPGGLPMAQRGEDRDGLKLDVLHIPLGPILYAWPAGLRLNVSMQGDVIQEAIFSPLENKGKHPSYWNEPWEKILADKQVTVYEAETRRIMAHLDSLQRLTMVSGDEGSTMLMVRLKHIAHLGKFTEEFYIVLNKLKKRLKGGQLENITQGIGRLTKEEAKEFGLTGPVLRACGQAYDQRIYNGGYVDLKPIVAIGEGDARSRWHQWLAEIELSLSLIKEKSTYIQAKSGLAEAPRGVLGLKEKPSEAIIKAICHLIKGQELAVARLLIASFDPDLDEL